MVVAAGGKESKEPFAAAGSRSSGQEAAGRRGGVECTVASTSGSYVQRIARSAPRVHTTHYYTLHATPYTLHPKFHNKTAGAFVLAASNPSKKSLIYY
jgi:hypothetical protein